MKHILKKIFKILFFIFVALIGTCLVFFLFLQTKSGKQQVASWAGSLLSTDSLQIEIKGIKDLLPWQLSLEKIALSDTQGTWLILQDGKLSWQPRELIKGRLQVKELSIKQVVFLRSPQFPEKEKKPGQEAESFVWPDELPALNVKRFEFSKIVLKKSFCQQEGSFSLAGNILLADEHSPSLKVDLRQLDKKGLKFGCQAVFLKNKDDLKLNVQLEETRSGFLHSCLALPFANSFSLSLHGQGPVRDWQGDLSLYQNASELVSCKLDASFDDQPGIKASGQAFVRDLLFSPYKELLSASSNFGFDVQLDLEKNSYRFKQAWLETSGAKLKLKGALNLAQKQVQADAKLDIPELKVLEPLISVPLKGQGSINTTFNGSLNAPDLQTDIVFEDLALNKFQVEQISIQASGMPLFADPPGLSGLQINSNASISGLQVNKQPIFSSPLNMDCQANIDFQGPLEISRASFELPGQKAVFQGKLEKNASFQGQLGLQVEQLAPYLKQQMAGIKTKCDLQADLKGNWQQKKALLAVSGTFSDFSGLPEVAQGLLAGRNQMQLKADIKDWERIDIQELGLNGQDYDLNVKGQIGLSRRLLDLDWQGQGPQFSNLAPAFHKQLQGGIISHQGSIKGQFTNFRAETTLSIPAFSAAAYSLKPVQLVSELDLDYQAERLQGKCQLALKSEKSNLKLSAALLRENGSLQVRDIQLKAPESSVSGFLTLGPQAGFPVFELQGQADSLAWTDAFWDTPLPQGKLDFRLQTANQARETNISLNLKAKDLSYLNNSISSLQADTDLKFTDITAFKSWTGAADLQIKELQKEGFYLDQVRIQGSGSLDDLVFSLDLNGKLYQDLQLALKGSAHLQGEDMAFSWETITGSWARMPFELKDAASMRISPEGLFLGPASLSLGKGALNLACSLPENQKIQAWAELQDIALPNFFPAHQVPLQGKLRGKASLQGTPARPVLEADFTAFDILPPNLKENSLAPGTVNVRAGYKEKELRGELNASMQEKDNFQAKLSMPASITLKPFALSKIKDSELQGRGNGTLDIQSLTRLLPLGGQEFGGSLDMDLALQGTISSLLWSGTLSLQKGSYDNFFSGTVLRDILARIDLDQYNIDIQELRATDGENGKISAAGKVGLNSASGISYDLSTEFEQASLVRLDTVNADISGQVDIKGSLSSAEVKGDLSVSPAELRIPEPGPPGMQGLEVVTLNATSSVPGHEEQGKKQSSFLHKLDLFLQVRAPAAVYVRGRGLESEWSGDLDVNGSAATPVITGDLELVRGHFDFLGKRFDLQKGQVIFQGQSPPEPVLQITAVFSSADLKVILEVSGPASNPQINLDSSPSYPSEEILSRLLFRRSVREITPLQAVKLALAVRSLTKGGPSLMDKARGFLGVDQLELRKESEEEGTVVGVGKYLNENIYFEVEKGMAEDSGRVEVEIEMTPNIALQSEMGMQSQGLQVKWKYSY